MRLKLASFRCRAFGDMLEIAIIWPSVENQCTIAIVLMISRSSVEDGRMRLPTNLTKLKDWSESSYKIVGTAVPPKGRFASRVDTDDRPSLISKIIQDPSPGIQLV